MFTVNGAQESSGLFFNYRWVDDVLSRTQGRRGMGRKRTEEAVGNKRITSKKGRQEEKQ